MFATLMGPFALGWKAWVLSGQRHLGLIAAGVAFFCVLAIFPAIAALVAIWGFFADPIVVANSMEWLVEYLPHEAYDLLFAQVQGLVGGGSTQHGWTTVISLGAALWSARAGVASLVQGINAAHGQEVRSSIWHQIVSLALTLAIVGAALTALAAGVLVPLFLALVPLGEMAAWVLSVAIWSIAPIVGILSIGLVYRYGPNLPRDKRPPLFTWGLLVAVVLWFSASLGFSWYLSNFANYNKVYGSIGAVIALLMWFYLSAYAVLIGAAVNAARADIDHERNFPDGKPPLPEGKSTMGDGNVVAVTATAATASFI